MRKFTLLLVIPLLLLTSVNRNFIEAQGVNMNGFNVTYQSTCYQPVDAYPSFQIEGSVNITNGTSRGNMRIRYECFSPLKFGFTKAYSSKNLTSTFSYPATKSFNYSFKFQDLDNLVRSGVTIRLGVYDLNSKSFLNYKDSVIYQKSDNAVNIDSLTNKSISLNRCLYLDDRSAVETFNFSSYGHILELESYYRFDLSSYTINYSFSPSNHIEQGGEAYLTFNDEHNLFPYINNEGEYKRINIGMSRSTNSIVLKLASLYVHPKTLSMSSTKKEGYVATNYFYLPRNKHSELQGQTFNIHARELGAHSLSFEYPFSLNADSLLLGPCNESLYCVVGGVEE